MIATLTTAKSFGHALIKSLRRIIQTYIIVVMIMGIASLPLKTKADVLDNNFTHFTDENILPPTQNFVLIHRLVVYNYMYTRNLINLLYQKTFLRNCVP